MYLNRLIFISVLMFLPCAQIIVLASQAYAGCCMCGSSCTSRCTCPGDTEDCEWCAAPNSNAVKIQSTPLSEGSGANLDIRSVRESVLSLASERILSSVDQSYGRKTMALRLLDNVESERLLWCPNSQDKNFQDEASGFQVKVDEER